MFARCLFSTYAKSAVLEQPMVQERSQLTTLFEIVVRSSKERARAVLVASTDNYRSLMHIDRFVTFPSPRTQEEADRYLDQVFQKELPDEVKTVGFISPDVLWKIVEKIPLSQIKEIVEASSPSPIERLICAVPPHRLWETRS